MGGFGGRDGGGQNQKQMLQARALMREVVQPAPLVTIVATPDTVSFTDDQGMVRRFTTDGKKQKVDLGTAEVEATTSWEIASLVQELRGGSVKVKRTWQVSDQGNQLVVEVATEGGRDAGGGGLGGPTAGTLRFVYDRVNPRAAATSSRAFASSASMFEASLPPASAKSGRPPPPPPTMGARVLTS
jgi:hypothetical protein